MKVLISWSGERSKQIAIALRNFLKLTIHATEPWVSDMDIGAGAVWLPELMGQLQEAKAGVICLTPENLESKWVHFEAGALAKAMGQVCVSPYLFDLKPSDVQGPLAILQYSVADKAGTRKIIESINDALGDNKLSEVILAQSFAAHWPRMHDQLKEIHDIQASLSEKPKARKPEDVMEEMLTLVRDVHSRIPQFLAYKMSPSMNDSEFQKIMASMSEAEQTWFSSQYRHALEEIMKSFIRMRQHGNRC